VSLGAGFDTAYFRMRARGLQPHLFVEVDFPELVARKIALIHNDALIT
jgi:O-methyltransferase involved in polyketide biosynthesis